MLTIDQVAAFDRDGFVVVEEMFSQEESNVLLKAVKEASRVDAHTFEARDVDGNVSKLSLWTDIGSDAFGAVSASPRIVNSMQILLRENVYHWHSKVMLKEATKGGAWEWHQDYGYWYHDGCAYPRMASAMLALDETTRENGCLKVMVGSHLLGRLEHGREGTQQGAELQRLAALEDRLPTYYVEAKPGSVLFFHCNLLHASEPNLSDRSRIAYICCYNTFSNIPVIGKGHGKPVPIALSADDAVLQFAE